MTAKTNRSKHSRRRGRRTFRLERIVKGFANHRRIEIMELLAKKPELSVIDITEILGVEYKAIAPHMQKLAQAGMVLKRHDGTHMHHKLSSLGRRVLTFLDSIE